MDAADRSPLPRRLSQTEPLAAEFDTLLDAGLAAIPLELTAPQRRALEAHARLLLAWNAHINLSGLRTAEQVARGHVLDALIAVPFLRSLSRRPPALLDLGSGGGFPGLPLAIALPAARVALVDSIAKKAAFLEAAAAIVSEVLAQHDAESPPQLDVLPERAEDLADEPDQREAWDLVVARAVGSVAEVAELGLPLVRRGGHLVIWKRAGAKGTEGTEGAEGQLDAELAAARRIVQAVGGRAPRRVPLDAAEAVGLANNCLVVIAKARPTPDRYPRSPGERRRAALP